MPEPEIVRGDLLDQRVDAIVNAWNRNFIPWWLLIPQGVSRAIKRRAGYQPFRELYRLGVLRPGQAVVTSAGRLPCRAIIHVAALNTWWRSSEAIIRDGVRNALRIAADRQFTSVALPLLGSGTGGVPIERALAVTEDEVRRADFGGHVVVVIYAPPSGDRSAGARGPGIAT
jgi:O-acetyl-ADP-ribose deacetylase (regulator of RNase III)